MRVDDLQKKVPCPRCGEAIAKVATFCPHCGYVRQESWWEKVVQRLDEMFPAERKPNSPALVSTVLGFLIAGFFLFQAIQHQSLQSLLIAVITLVLAVRSWFATRTHASESPSDEIPSVREAPREEAGSGPAAVQFYCENCGAEVAEDARMCSRCGMQFEG